MRMHNAMCLATLLLLMTSAVSSGQQPVPQEACGVKGCPGKEPPVEVKQSFYGNPDTQQAEPGKQRTATAPASQGPISASPVAPGSQPPRQKVPLPVNRPPEPKKPPAPSSQLSGKGVSSNQMLSGYSTPAVPVLDEQLGTSQRVMPEVVSQVQLSSSDINRIVCPVDIKDIVFSKEKGITVKLSGSNAFVKFLVMKREGRDHYSSIPTEIFIVCGDDIYNVVAIPKRIPSQTIQLAPGRMDALKKNMSAYGEMPLEKKIVTIIKQIYTDNIPDSITVQKVNKPYDIFQNVNVVHYKTFTVDGEGLRVKEFRATSEESREIYLREKDLIRHDLVRRPVAISIDVLNLKKGEMSRIFMVERTVDE